MNNNCERQTEIYLSTAELMLMLSVSRSTVYRLMEKGLPNILAGSVHRFPKEQVLSWLQGRSDKQRISRTQEETRN